MDEDKSEKTVRISLSGCSCFVYFLALIGFIAILRWLF